jgi:hypothetical protein
MSSERPGMPEPVQMVYDAIIAMEGASVEYSPPAGEGIYHYLDANWRCGSIEVRWSKPYGFEMGGSRYALSVFGQGYEEFYSSPGEVIERIVRIVQKEV